MSDPIQTNENDTTTTEETSSTYEVAPLVIDNSIFSKFTLSHKSSECKLPGEETISVYRVPEGTYFDESVVIDEYKKSEEETTDSGEEGGSTGQDNG